MCRCREETCAHPVVFTSYFILKAICIIKKCKLEPLRNVDIARFLRKTQLLYTFKLATI